MNAYNTSIATTTNHSPDDAIIGYSVKITTYNYLDLLVYFLLPIILIWVIRLFRRKK